jgi:hypothetical protein
MFTTLFMNRGMIVLKRSACCFAFSLLTLTSVHGQKSRPAQTTQEEAPAASIDVVTANTANGLQLVNIAADSYTSAALAMDWTFKPALELQRAGIGKAWARVLAEQWKSDTLGTGLKFSWVVTPTGFQGYGDAATAAEWGALMLKGLRASPGSEWPNVQADWIANWDSTYHVPSKIAQRVLQAEMFSLRHPYGERELPATLSAISQADVQNHAASYWHPNNGRLVFAGPSEQGGIPTNWIDIIEAWPVRELQKPAIPPPGKPRQNKAFIVESASDSVYIAAGHLMRLKPSHPDALPLLLLAEHLASTTDDSFAVVLDPLMSSIGFNANRSASAASAAVRSLQSAMAAATQSAPTVETLERWKDAAHARTLMDLQTPLAAARLYLRDADWFYAAADTAWEVFTAPVRPNDIQRVAINYLRPNQLQLVAVGPVDAARAVAEAFATSQHIEWYDVNGEPKPPFGPVPDGLTALEVIRSHYDACGGVQEFAALNSCRRTGTMEAGGGMVMNLESEEIYGTGHRTSIAIDGQQMMEQLIQPGKGLSFKLGKPQPMPKAEYLRHEGGLYAMELLALAERNLIAELVGSYQQLEGQEWVVDLSREGVLVQRLFFNTDTHLLTRSEEYRRGPTGPMEVFIEYNGYKAFDGLLYATRITRQTNNQRMVTTLEEVQPDARVNRNQFEWE